MNWRELEQLLINGALSEPDARANPTLMFAEWFGTARRAPTSATRELCDFAWRRVIHAREDFPDQFHNEKTWWSASSLFHTSAQVALLAESGAALTLADSAWQSLCKAIGVQPKIQFSQSRDELEQIYAASFYEKQASDSPEPSRSSAPSVKKALNDFREALAKLQLGAIPAALVGSDILRLRSLIYASGGGPGSLERAESDLQFALELINSDGKKKAPIQVDKTLPDLFFVPHGINGVSPQAFILSDSILAAVPLEILLGQEVSLRRELALLNAKLSNAAILSGNVEAGRKFLQASNRQWRAVRDLFSIHAPTYSTDVISSLETVFSELLKLDLNRISEGLPTRPATAIAIKRFVELIDLDTGFRRDALEIFKLIARSDLRQDFLVLLGKAPGGTSALLRKILDCIPPEDSTKNLGIGNLVEGWAGADTKLEDGLLAVWLEWQVEALQLEKCPEGTMERILEDILNRIVRKSGEDAFRNSASAKAVKIRARWIRHYAPACSKLVDKICLAEPDSRSAN